MLAKIVFGPLKGAVLGLLLAVALRHSFDVAELTGTVSYLAALATGFFAGMFAGKPVWASAAKTEALLKAIAGGAMAAGVLFVLRRFIHTTADLGPLGSGPLLELPLVVLPGLGALLAFLFEVDDAVGRAHDSPKRPK